MDNWNEHFRLDDATIVGLTPSGRATAKLLNFNAPRRTALRHQLNKQGEEI
jgi:hypothetical protein